MVESGYAALSSAADSDKWNVVLSLQYATLRWKRYTSGGLKFGFSAASESRDREIAGAFRLAENKILNHQRYIKHFHKSRSDVYK